MIPSMFLTSKEELREARKKNMVVKVSWAGSNMVLLNRSKGVAMPEGDIEQSNEERWNLLDKLLDEKAVLIAQQYIRPAKIKAYLRKKGTNLEKVNWYNRICAKYVCLSNPNSRKIPDVVLTATEVTLGPNIIPSGRECAFTAAKFS
jgi:lambda repressor-like predicted transcriptional regulator